VRYLPDRRRPMKCRTFRALAAIVEAAPDVEVRKAAGAELIRRLLDIDVTAQLLRRGAHWSVRSLVDAWLREGRVEP
jgi:hypothetical protein